MSKVVVVNNLTLDGVMQAPGRPDEDRRGGFAHGGWAWPRGDAVMGSAAGASMATSGALLLGRRTYEDFYAYWPMHSWPPCRIATTGFYGVSRPGRVSAPARPVQPAARTSPRAYASGISSPVPVVRVQYQSRSPRHSSVCARKTLTAA